MCWPLQAAWSIACTSAKEDDTQLDTQLKPKQEEER